MGQLKKSVVNVDLAIEELEVFFDVVSGFYCGVIAKKEIV